MDERTTLMLEEYNAGRSIQDICRQNNIGPRRFYALMEGVETFRSRKPVRPLVKPALSSIHRRIGITLYEYYSSKGLDRRLAANRLGWSSLCLRHVELGTHNLTIFELQDIQAFTGIPYEDLMKHGS